MATCTITIGSGGKLRFIHHDRLSGVLAPLGTPQVTRASHVESDDCGQWWADLSPVGGPRLGPYPLDQRQQALDDERKWLEANYLQSRVA